MPPSREDAIRELYRRGALNPQQTAAVEELSRRGKFDLEIPAPEPSIDPLEVVQRSLRSAGLDPTIARRGLDKSAQEALAGDRAARVQQSQRLSGLLQEQEDAFTRAREIVGEFEDIPEAPTLDQTFQEAQPDVPVLREVASGFQQSILTSASAAERAFGSDERATELNQIAGKLGAADAERGRLAKGISGATRSFTDLLTGGGGATAIPLFALKATNSAIDEGRAAGLTGSELARFAVTQGAIEGTVTAAFQLVGAGGLESSLRQPVAQGIREAAKQLGKNFGFELVEELSVELGQRINSFLSDVDTDALNQEQLTEAVLDITIQTALTLGAAQTPAAIETASQPLLERVRARREAQQQPTETGPDNTLIDIPGVAPTQEQAAEVPPVPPSQQEQQAQETAQEQQITETIEQTLGPEEGEVQPPVTRGDDATDLQTTLDTANEPGQTEVRPEDVAAKVAAKPSEVPTPADATPKATRAGRVLAKVAAAVRNVRVPGREVLADWLAPRATFKRPAEWVKGKTDVRAVDAIARERSLKVVRRFTEALGQDKSFDINKRENAGLLTAVLEGRQDIEAVPAHLRDVLTDMRAIQDQQSANLADALEEAGLDARAKVVRDNIGKFVKSVPEFTLKKRNRIVQSLKAYSSGLQVSKGLTKVRRDKFIVSRLGRVLGKFDTREQAQAFVKANQKAGQRFKIQEPRTQEERFLEDVQDPRLTILAGTTEAAHDARVIRLHKQVSEQWGEKPPEGLDEKGIQEWAEENNLVKLPNQGRFHNLRNVFVQKEIADDLTEFVDVPTGIAKLFRDYMSVFKKGVVIYNPASHGRNILTNAVFFSYLGNTSIFNPKNAKHYKDAWTALSEKGPLWEEMVRAGAIDGDFFTAEIESVRKEAIGDADPSVGKLMGWIGRGTRFAKEAYQFEDTWFKAAAYLKYKQDGMESGQAAEEVNTWFPNYNRTAKLTQWLTRNPVGPPFGAFLDQSIRIAGRGVARRPAKIALIYALPGILNEVSRALVGVGEEEDKVIRASQSFLETYFTPYLPWRDSKGNVLTFDLRYTVPLANDIIPRIQNGTLNIPWLANGPVFNAAIEQISGRDTFTGRDISGGMEKLESLFNNLAPVPPLARQAGQAAVGEGRFARAAEDTQTSEDMAYAIVGSIVGINARRPFIAEEQVREAVTAAVEDGDTQMAAAMIKRWNRQYKPDFLKPLSIAKIRKSIKRRKKKEREER